MYAAPVTGFDVAGCGASHPPAEMRWVVVRFKASIYKAQQQELNRSEQMPIDVVSMSGHTALTVDTTQAMGGGPVTEGLPRRSAMSAMRHE